MHLQEQDSDNTNLTRFSTFWHTFWRIFKLIIADAVPRGLSYTYSAQIFFLFFLLNRISQSEDETAAITLIATLLNSFNNVVFAPVFVVSNIECELLGELKNAKQRGASEEELQRIRDKIVQVNQAGILIALALAPFIITPLIFSGALLEKLGQDPAVCADVQAYMNDYMWAFFSLGVRTSIEQTVFSFKRSYAAMTIGIGDLVVTSGLALWLSGKYGARGVALPNMAESNFTALFLGIYLGINRKFRHYRFFTRFRDIKGVFKQAYVILKRGAAFTINAINEVMLTLATGLLAGYVGVLPQAALTYAMGTMFFTLIWTWASAQVCANTLSQQLGVIRSIVLDSRENSLACTLACSEARHIGVFGLFTSVFLCLVPLVLVTIFPRALLFMFGNSSPEIEAFLNGVVRLISFGAMCDIFRNNLLQQLRVLGDALYSTFVSFCGLASGMIFSVIMLNALSSSNGIYGVAGGYALGFFIAAMALAVRWANHIQPESIKQYVISQVEEERLQQERVTRNVQQDDVLRVPTSSQNDASSSKHFVFKLFDSWRRNERPFIPATESSSDLPLLHPVLQRAPSIDDASSLSPPGIFSRVVHRFCA